MCLWNFQVKLGTQSKSQNAHGIEYRCAPKLIHQHVLKHSVQCTWNVSKSFQMSKKPPHNSWIGTHFNDVPTSWNSPTVAVAAWIGHGTFADRYPGGRISKRCCSWGPTCWKIGNLPESYNLESSVLAVVNTKTSWCCQDWPTHNLSGAARQDWGSSSEPCGCTFLGLNTGVWC